jgi:hypothetical protein
VRRHRAGHGAATTGACNLTWVASTLGVSCLLLLKAVHRLGRVVLAL